MKRKIWTSVGLGGALLFALPALACPVAPATGFSTFGSPVCIAPYGNDGPGTGLPNILGTYNATTNPYGIIVSGPVPNVYTDQTVPSSFWSIGSTGSSENTIVIEIAGNSGSNTFGIFDPTDPSNTLQLFSGSAGAGWSARLQNNGGGHYTVSWFNAAGIFQGQTTATFGVTNVFGYYLSGPGGTFYSLASLNPTDTYYTSGMPHMVAYQGNGSSVLKIGNTTGTWLQNEFIMAWEDTAFKSSDLDYNDFVVSVESVHPVPEPAVLGIFGLGLFGVLFAVGLHRRRQKK